MEGLAGLEAIGKCLLDVGRWVQVKSEDKRFFYCRVLQCELSQEGEVLVCTPK